MVKAFTWKRADEHKTQDELPQETGRHKGAAREALGVQAEALLLMSDSLSWVVGPWGLILLLYNLHTCAMYFSMW